MYALLPPPTVCVDGNLAGWLTTPTQVEAHKRLFVDGDVEGWLTPEAEEGRRIHTPRSLDASAEETLEWAVDVLISELRLKLASSPSSSG